MIQAKLNKHSSHNGNFWLVRSIEQFYSSPAPNLHMKYSPNCKMPHLPSDTPPTFGTDVHHIIPPMSKLTLCPLLLNHAILYKNLVVTYIFRSKIYGCEDTFKRKYRLLREYAVYYSVVYMQKIGFTYMYTSEGLWASMIQDNNTGQYIDWTWKNHRNNFLHLLQKIKNLCELVQEALFYVYM